MKQVSLHTDRQDYDADALRRALAERFGNEAFMLLMIPRRAILRSFDSKYLDAFFADGGTVCVFDRKGEWACEAEAGSPARVTSTEEDQAGEPCLYRETSYPLRHVAGMDVPGDRVVLWREYFRIDENGMLKNVASRYAGIGGGHE